MEYADGTWSAFEIKLGIGAVDAAANNLLKFAAKIDTAKRKPPAGWRQRCAAVGIDRIKKAPERLFVSAAQELESLLFRVVSDDD